MIANSASPVLVPVRTASPTDARIDYVDALRGLACFFVVVYHLWNGMHPDKIQHFLAQHPNGPVMGTLYTVFSFGASGVPLFLALSGFCLFWPVLRKHPLAEVQVDYRQFMVRRARRILPPYYVALLLFILYELLVPSRVTGEYAGGVKSFLALGDRRWLSLIYPGHIF